MLKVSQPSPSFTLEGVAQDGETFQRYAVSEGGRGRWTVIFFYPMDFTFVCPTEITAFGKAFEEFQKLDADVYGISTDSVHAHKAWIAQDLGKLPFPLLADPTHDVSRQYGVLLEDKGIALRGLFIVDPDGMLRYQLVHDLRVGRTVQETLRVLAALQTGELCPIDWTPGTKTLGKA